MKIPDGWKLNEFGKAVSFNPKVKFQKGEQYTFIEMDDVNAEDKFVTGKGKRIYTTGSCSKFRNNDVLFARITPCLDNKKIATVAIGENEVGFGSTEFIILRAKENVTVQEYVHYLSKSEYIIQNAINSYVGASGRQRADAKFIKKVLVLLPKIPEQQRIASILSAYDDLIEINNKRIALLEQMAEQVYKEWFVRMRFPGYQDAEFEKGLPKWEVVSLNKIINLISGYAFKGEDFLDTPTNNVVVRMGNFNMTRGLKFDTNAKYFPEDYHVKSKHKLSAGDLLMVLSDVTRDGSIIGNVGIVPADNRSYILNQRVSKIICNKKLKIFLYCHLSSLSFKNYCLSRADSATVLNLSNRHIYEYKLLLPPEYLIEKFQNIIKPLIDEIEFIHLLIENLKQTRDLLLPRLISGKLRVKDLKNNLANKMI